MTQELGGFKSFKRSFSLEPDNLLAINLAIRAAFETAILSVWFRALSVRFGGLSVRFRGISVGFRLLLITKWNAGLVANWIAGPGGVLKRVALEPTQLKSDFSGWPQNDKKVTQKWLKRCKKSPFFQICFYFLFCFRVGEREEKSEAKGGGNFFYWK